MAEPRLVRWFTEHASELAVEVTREYHRTIPYYAARSMEDLQHTVVPAVEVVVALSAEMLRQGRTEFAPEERRLAIEWWVRRARQGLPLEAALLSSHIATEVCWRAIVAQARPDETDQVIRIASHLLGFLREVTPAVTVAHVQTQQDHHDDQREARRVLFGALMAGEPAEPLAVRAGIELADSYVAVVAVFCGDEPAAGQMVRAVRDVQDALATTLSSVSPRGVTALLPGTVETIRPQLHRITVDVSRAADRTVVAGVADADDIGSIPDAAREASEVATLVARLDRPPGVYTLDDVILEYQLARPGGGLARLAARLDPIADRADLMGTLRAFIACGHHRGDAAQELHVHRNTLDYRLRGVAERTGLDPGRPRDAHLLAAALNARDLLEGHPSAGPL